jgi:cell surface protein SprA
LFFQLFFSSVLLTTFCIVAGYRTENELNSYDATASPHTEETVVRLTHEEYLAMTESEAGASSLPPDLRLDFVSANGDALWATAEVLPDSHSHPDANPVSEHDAARENAAEFFDDAPPQDTSKKKSRVRWNDSPADAANRPQSRSLVLPPPKNYRVEYELEDDGSFTVKEKYGDHEARNRSLVTRQELMKTRERDDLRNFLREKGREEYRTNENFGGISDALLPKIKVNSKAFETIFGSNKIDIKPNIVVMMTPSVRINVNKNPQLTQRQQRNVAFNFDQNIQMDVTGSIGDKFKIRTNYDTKATFNFENQFKINFQGKEDDIIKTIEAGNVSLPLNGSLITGGQNLWGVKVGTQWGPVWVTAVASQQRGQTNEITVQGGAQQTPFEKRAHEYDEGRHFFLCHYFRESYEQALRNLPNVQSRINVDRVEVWITNRNNQNTVNNRNAVGLVDLGEGAPGVGQNAQGYKNPGGRIHNTERVRPTPGDNLPQNSANNLYQLVSSRPEARERNTAVTALRDGVGLRTGQDFEMVENMRLLGPQEYTLNPRLGYITLNTRLQPNDVLFVAFRFRVVGSETVYQVGEFTDNVPSNAQNNNVLFLKMLKPAEMRPGIAARNPGQGTPYPAWDLMMKNIYNIGGYNLKADGFDFNIVYESTDGSGDINYLPTGRVANRNLLQVFGVDRLTNHSEAGADNRYDFIPGYTVVPDKGLIIFPVLEPFGDYLVRQMQNAEDSALYAFPQLYRYTQVDAQQYFQQQNRFKFRGRFSGAGGQEIYLNAVQIAQGSVKVIAGGSPLTEGVDYTVDYTVGKVTITNPGVLSSGQDIKIRFETNTLFGIDQKTLVGARVDFKQWKNLTFGGTILHLNERPLINKVNIGDEPVANTLWGMDVNWKQEARFLTTLVDKLPFYSTKAASEITLMSEFAHFIPGQPRQLSPNRADKGVAYIDDFEGSRNVIDLLSPNLWKIASYPNAPHMNAKLQRGADDTRYGYNRAKLAWYSIDPLFYDSPNLFGWDEQTPDLSRPYTRRVEPFEVFPNRNPPPGQNVLMTLDLHYQPKTRGFYNFQTDPAKINPDGAFKFPKENWAGIMRRTTGNTDFEASNFEFIEFWLMDPFLEKPNHTGGDLYINLGRVSEDVLKDDRRSFENGLPNNADGNRVTYDAQGRVTNAGTNLTATPWGRVSDLLVPTNAFDNDPNARRFQDVGLDGLGDDEERRFFARYLEALRAFLTPEAMAAAENDPGSDNFVFFRDNVYGPTNTLQERYSRFNGQEGNSPIPTGGDAFARQGSPSPDVEDINADATLNTTESYYEYRIRLRPQDLAIGKNYIVDIRDTLVDVPDKIRAYPPSTEPGKGKGKWYLFRVPLRRGAPVNGILDFKAIDFIRMYLTDFEEDITLRFGKFELVATPWRQFVGYLGPGGDNVTLDPDDPTDATRFEVGTVNVEENGKRSPFPYVIPPDIIRQQQPGNPIQNQLMNEQSFVMRVANLKDGDARGAFRTVSYDMRNYQKLRMWTHVEPYVGCANSHIERCEQIKVFVRLGTDLTQNYYEYEMPICPSEPNNFSVGNIWKDFTFDLELLNRAKVRRNDENRSFYEPYYFTQGLPEGHRVTVVGNPQLNNVKNVMVGIRNPSDNLNNTGPPICAEMWINELRVTGFDQTHAWATNHRLNVKLADLANLTLNASYATPRFGNIEQRINQRSQQMMFRYGGDMTIGLGKLLPKNWGMEIPTFLSYERKFVEPRFNPLDPDVLLSTTLESYENPNRRRAKYDASVDDMTTYSIQFNNVRKTRGPNQKKQRFWDVENFAVSFGYNDMVRRNAQIEYWRRQEHRFGIGYTYNFANAKGLKPFGFAKSVKLLSDFQINYLPRSVTLRLDGLRSFEEQKLRQVSAGDLPIPPTFQQNFLVTRTYQVNWAITNGINLMYNAVNESRIDEPRGRMTFNQLAPKLLSFGKSPLDPEPDAAYLSTLNEFERNDTLARYYNRQTYRYNHVNMGRTMRFKQDMQLSYRLPLDKIKPIDWITATATYSASYQWQTAALQNFALGNTINNSGGIQGNGQLNFSKFYKKFPVIEKKILKPVPKRNIISLSDSTRKEGDDLKIAGVRIYKALAQIAFSIQRLDVNVTRNTTTTLPGYLPGTDNFGVDWTDQRGLGRNVGADRGGGTANAPGFEYIVGWQNLIERDRFGNVRLGDWFRKARQHGWISRDTNMIMPFMVTLNRNYTARMNMTPLKGMNIDFNADRQESENFTAVHAFNNSLNDYALSNQAFNGSFSTTTIGMVSIFGKGDAVFQRFNEYRQTISGRLRSRHTNYGAAIAGAEARPFLTQNGRFWNGYTGSQQEVLLPAFMAAYLKKKPDQIHLGPAPQIPLPNWAVNFNLVQTFEGLKDIFKSVTLRHGYTATYRYNYLLNLSYQDRNQDGFADNAVQIGTDSTGGSRFPVVNFLPRFTIESVVLTESFSPLVGVNFSFKNGITTQFDFKRSRTLTFNVAQLQLNEARVTDLTISFQWMKNGLLSPITIFNRSLELKNTMTFRAEFSLRSNKTQNRRLDSDVVEPTNGSFNVSFRISLDYMVNTQLSIQPFIQHNRNDPVISTSFPTRFTEIGVQVRFTLN